MRKEIRFRKWKFIGSIFGITAGVQFIIISLIMMALYPGGYSFWDNSFSSLGYYESTSNGEPNLICLVLYIITFTSFTILLIPLYLSLRVYFRNPKFLMIISWIAMILYLISVPVGIIFSLYPGDLYPETHDRLTSLYYSFILSSIFVISIIIYYNEDYENYYGTIGIIVLIIALSHIYIFKNTVLQKITICSLIFWCLIQSIKLKKDCS